LIMGKTLSPSVFGKHDPFGPAEMAGPSRVVLTLNDIRALNLIAQNHGELEFIRLSEMGQIAVARLAKYRLVRITDDERGRLVVLTKLGLSQLKRFAEGKL
jgi:hypothetical protein